MSKNLKKILEMEQKETSPSQEDRDRVWAKVQKAVEEKSSQKPDAKA